MNKKYKIISFSILFFFIIILSYFQSLSQHWSAYFDMDIWIVYNSSLIASGYEQEFRDQPAFTIFFINAFIFKIFNFFNSNFIFKIDDINNSENSNQVLSNLFILLRFINSLLVVLTLLFLYKILRILDINKLQSFIALLIISFSHTFYQNLFQLRPEILSLLTFLISFYILLFFFKKKKDLYYLFLAGIFFSFSMLTSIKIIFLFLFIFLLIPILNELYEKKNYEFILLNENKIFSFCIIFYAILVSSYVYLEIYYISNHPRFESSNNIDLKIFIIFNFLYLFYLFYFSKFEYYKFKKNFCIFSFYLIGYCLGIFFFLFLDLLNLTQISFPVIGRLTNPFYYMSIYSITAVTGVGTSYSTLVGLENLIEIFNNFLNNFYFNKILFISLFFILMFSLWIDVKQKNNKLLYFKIILFICLIFNILIFNLRYFLLYEIIVYPIYLILLLICLKNFSNKNANLFLCLIFLYSFSTILESSPDPRVNNFNGIKNYFNRKELLTKICDNKKETINIINWQYWTPRLNDNFFNRLCYNLKD